MFLRGAFLLLISILSISDANTLQGIIDLKRLQNILEENVKSKDITSLYYSVTGLVQLNANLPNICEDLKNIKYDVKNIEQVFQVANTAAITGCQNSLKPDVLTAATQVLDKKDATIADIYHAVYTLKALGKGSVYDKEDALKNLIQLLKKDDSPANYGYVFALCEHMGCGAWTASHAEGVLLAADESDSKALHFDGGLPVTSNLLTTIIRTYKNLKKPSPFSEEQRYKFAEYLLSRRSVTTAKGATLLLEAAIALADDQPSPVSISIKGKNYITSERETIEFSITDLVGRALPRLRPDEVVAQSATRLADDVVVLSKQPLAPRAARPGLFVLDLAKLKAQYGLYKVALSAGPGAGLHVTVAVLGDVRVADAELGVGDADGASAPRLSALAYPDKLADALQADHLQKLSLKFSVRDKWNKAVLVQQAFVRVARAGAPAHETIFVAEPDSAKAYKVELNVGNIAKHLNYESGTYSLTIYLGDSAVSNPIAWHVGDVTFNFGKDTNALGAAGPARRAVRGPLPEIAHAFRSAEARPARLVSDVFALACAAPLALLLALWAALGVNLANLPLAPSALVFHLALGGSLSLYGVLWLQLTMFETVRYLLPLAALTFLSGHRLLARLARDKVTSR